jgi:hypothetical protein
MRALWLAQPLVFGESKRHVPLNLSIRGDPYWRSLMNTNTLMLIWLTDRWGSGMVAQLYGNPPSTYIVSEPGVSIRPAVPASNSGAIIVGAGDKASEHFLEFFAATIRNQKIRARPMSRVAQCCRRCDGRRGIRGIPVQGCLNPLVLEHEETVGASL